MSQAIDSHETIILNIGALLRDVLHNQPDIREMGSSKVACVPDCMLAPNPDVLVVKGESQLMPRKRRAAGIVNPYILVEVRSDLTAMADETQKLPCYKLLESVQHIVHVNQYYPYVSVCTKNQDVRHWFNDDYDDLTQTVQLGDVALPMHEIYHKVLLTETLRSQASKLSVK